MKEDWFCGNDGNSYINDCLSASKDCMSDTITRVHDGKCASAPKGMLLRITFLIEAVIIISVLVVSPLTSFERSSAISTRYSFNV